MFSQLDSKQQLKLLGMTPVNAKELFEIRSLGDSVVTHDVTFSSTDSNMVVNVEDGIRNVVGMDVVGLSLANPFITISSMNCCLTFTSGTATGTDHYLIMQIGDYSGTEMEVLLNKGLVKLFGDDRLFFEYSIELSKMRLFNKSPNTTYFIPTKTTIETQLAVSGMQNVVGSIWPTLGFAIDSTAIELRSQASRGSSGQPGAPTAPTNFFNSSELMSLPIPEDPSVTKSISGVISVASGSTAVTGYNTRFTVDLLGKSYLKFDETVYSIGSITNDTELVLSTASHDEFSLVLATTEENMASVLASYPMAMPYESFGRSALNLYQAGLYETPFSLRNSKKMLYMVAPDIETAHHVASANSTVKKCSAMVTLPSSSTRPFPDKHRVEMYKSVPDEAQVGMNGVIAVIPVVSQQVQLQGFDHIPIDLRKNPISHLKSLRLKLIDQTGEPVDMRGRGITCTIQFTMRTQN